MLTFHTAWIPAFSTAKRHYFIIISIVKAEADFPTPAFTILKYFLFQNSPLLKEFSSKNVFFRYFFFHNISLLLNFLSYLLFFLFLVVPRIPMVPSEQISKKYHNPVFAVSPVFGCDFTSGAAFCGTVVFVVSSGTTAASFFIHFA